MGNWGKSEENLLNRALLGMQGLRFRFIDSRHSDVVRSIDSCDLSGRVFSERLLNRLYTRYTHIYIYIHRYSFKLMFLYVLMCWTTGM